MEQREEKVRLWFDMWLRGRDLGISRIFAPMRRAGGRKMRASRKLPTGFRSGIPEAGS